MSRRSYMVQYEMWEKYTSRLFGARGGKATFCDWIGGERKNVRLRGSGISTLRYAYLAGG